MVVSVRFVVVVVIALAWGIQEVVAEEVIAGCQRIVVESEEVVVAVAAVVIMVFEVVEALVVVLVLIKVVEVVVVVTAEKSHKQN